MQVLHIEQHVALHTRAAGVGFGRMAGRDRCGCVRRCARSRPARRLGDHIGLVQETAHACGRRQARQAGRSFTAGREHTIAARREAALVEFLPQRRHGAGDGCQRAAALAGVGQRLQQQPRVGVLGCTKEFFRGSHLDDLAGIHQRDPVRHARHHGQIVGDEHQAHALLFLQLLEQVENLSLDRHVERGCRLVGDDEVGLAGQRDCDHHALLLAAAHAKRVLVDAALRLGDADPAQPVDGLLARRRTAQRRVRFDRLDDLLADLHHRVQARRRLLKDHSDLAAPDASHLRFGQRQRVLAVQVDAAFGDAAVFRQQSHQRKRGHALAAAGLADQREGLAAFDRERQAVDGFDETGFGVECDLEVLDVQHVVVLGGARLGPNHSRPEGA